MTDPSFRSLLRRRAPLRGKSRALHRVLAGALLVSLSCLLSGCPVFPDQGCYGPSDCAPGRYCDRLSGRCLEEAPDHGNCGKPADCGGNQTCSRAGACEDGDCTFWGCVDGYFCDPSGGAWTCIDGDPSTGSAGSSSLGGAGGGPAADSAGASGGPGGSTP